MVALVIVVRFINAYRVSVVDATLKSWAATQGCLYDEIDY